jgi:hypothetical protein
MLTTHSHPVPRLSMSRSFSSSPPCVSMACSQTALLYVVSVNRTYLIIGGVLLLVAAVLITLLLWCIEDAGKALNQRKFIQLYFSRSTYYTSGPQAQSPHLIVAVLRN